MKMNENERMNENDEWKWINLDESMNMNEKNRWMNGWINGWMNGNEWLNENQ